jgi:cobalt-zinc-cadmium resistance protein CzcA
MVSVVATALRQRLLVVLAFAAVVVAGAAGFFQLNIEAYPDPVPPLVDIVTQSAGQSAEEIERYITIPIEVQMSGIPHVQAIRTISLFGLSDVKLQFTYDFTYEQAEQWVINRLSQLNALPNGAQPQISPASPVGEIYRYRLAGPPGYTLTELKTLQDWVLQRRLKAVPGVIDVTGWGGKIKTYQVTVDQQRLAAFGLGLGQVLQALANSNINVGGQTITFGTEAAVVRGVGIIRTVDDIRNTMIASAGGNPVLVRDVAEVGIGAQPRLGIAGQDDDDDIVAGIVLMRRGEQSSPTIRRVQAEIAAINESGLLPAGVRIEKIYDRSELIAATTRTVVRNMLFGIALIFAVQWLFLGDLRCAVVVASTVPFALAFAIGLMLLFKQSANLLSVGAIDFGLVVDATVIMVENIFRHLGEDRAHRRAGYAGQETAKTLTGFRGKFAVILASAAQVNRAIFFAAAIIIAGFVPLFTMSGIEGHIFGPMAKTYAYAILGGLIATFTVAPALSSYLLQDGVREHDTRLVVALRRALDPAIAFALDNRILVLGLAALLFVLSTIAAGRVGLEFLPKLEEGNLWIRASLPPAISLEAGDEAVNRIRRLLHSFPETQTVISQHGRPDDGTDATGFFNAEFFVPLKPPAEWPAGADKETLVRDVKAALAAQFVGIDFSFSQYIEDNVEEAASGVKGENSVKIFGDDLDTLERLAAEVKAVLAGIPGVADVDVLNSLGQPTVRIDVDRTRAARFGLTPGDINATVQAAIGGQGAGDLYEPGSDRHYAIMVRLAPAYRDTIEAIRQLSVNAPGLAAPVALKDVAEVRLVSGAAFIYREGQQRYIPVKFSVRGRDLGSAVLEAQRAVAAQVKVPHGYRLAWVGEFGNLQDALRRLAVAVPLSIFGILLLLYLNFGRLGDTLLAASVIPMAMVGGLFALWLTGTPFSISAAMGFVALFGIAAMDGIIVIASFRQQCEAGLDLAAAIARTCSIQARPVLMTCIVACVGLLPAAVSTEVGAQVQRPLALVVVGGMLFAPVLVLVLLPTLIAAVYRPGTRPTPDAALAAGEVGR